MKEKRSKLTYILVAIIVILILSTTALLISIPKLEEIVKENRKDYFITSVKQMAEVAETIKLSNDKGGENKTITCSDVSKLTNNDYESCIITFDEKNNAEITIEGKGKYEGISICSGTKNKIKLGSECKIGGSCFSIRKEAGVISIIDYSDICSKDVIIPSGIKAIEKDAFRGNKLTSVVIPNSVEIIGDYAFEDNELTSVTIPNSIVEIGTGAFNNNKLSDNDAYIYKRNNDGSIDNTYLVSYGGVKKDLIIPDNIKTIGQSAFEGNELTNVTIPNSVIEIGESAFAQNKLTNIIIPDSVKIISDGAFEVNLLTSVTIPNSVTTIGTGAFAQNKLTNVTIPGSVETIGAYAFEGQYGSMFYNNEITSLKIENGVKKIEKGAFKGNYLTSVVIPDSVETIGDYAFYANKLTSLNIPDSVTTIGKSAFYSNQLTSLNIPNSVISIGGGAFNNNKLSENDAYIYKRNGDGSIDNTHLVSYGGTKKDIIIPNSVTIIGDSTFEGAQLTSVSIPNSVTVIGNSAFFYNELTSVTIPNSVKEIGKNAFGMFYEYSNSKLTSIINKTGRSFDWSSIIVDSNGTPAVTGTYNGVNVTTE